MSKPFFIAGSTRTPRGGADAADVAARHLVYKLYEATNGQPGAWQLLRTIGERPETVARAVERGWLIVRDGEAGRAKAQNGMLTEAGRRVARKGVRDSRHDKFS
jgi:hypothetical protein